MKNPTPPHKRTKSAEHHYFPKSLQRYWRNSEGLVHRRNSSGDIKTSKNGTFGHIRNAHRIQIADVPTVWDESFEYIFGRADTGFRELVGSLQNCIDLTFAIVGDISARFLPVWQFEQDSSLLSECIASLVVRSPGFRNSIRVAVQPFHDGPVPDHLISGNQQHVLTDYAKAMSQRGKYIFMIAGEGEFIFGDGMLNNFRSGGPPSPYNPRCLVPLTPQIAIAYDCPSSYSVPGRFMSIRLSQQEVDKINFFTMVYSKEHIYYRNQCPKDLAELERNAFQQFQYHNPEWLEDVFMAASNSRFQMPA